jgi:hypothetical protein
MQLKTATDQATQRVRPWNCWIVLQPTGNYYLTSRKADAVKDEIVVGVVRKGTTYVEFLRPRCWQPQRPVPVSPGDPPQHTGITG